MARWASSGSVGDMKKVYKIRPRDIVSEKIRSYIVENNLGPGDRLPSERAMCEMWDLNRTTLRFAVSRLASEGVLVSKRGAGMFVAPTKIERDLQDILGFSAAVSAAGHIPSTKTLFQGVDGADDFAASRLGVELGAPVVVVKRMRSIDGEPVAVELSYFRRDLCEGFEELDLSKEPLYETLRTRYGVSVTHGSENIRVTYVDELEAELLGVEPGKPAFFQEGVVYDAAETPVECFKVVFLTNRIRLASTMRRLD